MNDLTPDDAIKQGLDLYKSLYNQTHDKAGNPNDVKVQSLFLAKKGDGLEFVEKRSIKGVLIRLQDKLCSLVGFKGPLHSASNFARAQQIFAKMQGTSDASSATKFKLNQVASEIIELQETESKTQKIEIVVPFSATQERVEGLRRVRFQTEVEPQRRSDDFDECLAVLGSNSGSNFGSDSADISIAKCKELVSRFVENNPELQQLVEPVMNAIDLSREDATAAIKSELEANGRCFMYAGQTMYEASIQKNGKITFAVYSQTDTELHNLLEDPYRTRRQPCFELADIAQEHFLRPSFLSVLAKTSEQGIREEVIAMLGGKPTTLDNTTQRLLSTKRSGAPEYRSYLAALSHCMTPQQFREFKCDFKLFMYERFCTAIEQAVASPMDYEAARMLYNEASLTKEKFAASVDKLRFVLPLEIDAIRKSNERMQKALNLLEAQIKEHEQNALPLPDRLEPSQINLDDFSEESSLEVESETVTADLLSPEYLAVEAKIKNLVNPTPDKVLDCLEDIDGSIELYELLFKKVGGLDALLQMNFGDDAYDTFRDFFRTMACSVDSYHNPTDARSYMLYFASTALLEKHLRKQDATKLLVANDFPSLLGLVDSTLLNQLTSTDPFWAAQLAQVERIAKEVRKESVNFFPSSEGEQGVLSSSMKTALLSWFDGQEPLQKQLQQELIQQAEEQKARIEEESRMPQQMVDMGQDIVKLAALFLSGNPLSQDEQAFVQASYDRADALVSQYINSDKHFLIDVAMRNKELAEWLLPPMPAILGNYFVPLSADAKKAKAKETSVYAKQVVSNQTDELKKISARIYSDPKYLPKNFASDKATVLFAMRPQWFPEAFRTLLTAAAIARDVENRTREHATYNELDDKFFELESGAKGYKVTAVSAGTLASNVVLNNRFRAAIGGGALTNIYDKGFPRAQKEEQVVQVPKFFGVRQEIAREYYQLHSVHGARIEAVVSYCRQHGLQGEDRFNMICSLIFESDIFLQELQDPEQRKQLVAMLKSFLADSIDSAIQVEDYKTAAKLAWLASMMQKSIDYVAKEDQLIAPEQLLRIIEKSADKKYVKDQAAIFYHISEALKDTKNEKLQAFALLLEPLRKQFGSDEKSEVAYTLQRWIQEPANQAEAVRLLQLPEISTFLATLFPRLGHVTFVADNGILYGEQNGKRLITLDLTRQTISCTQPELIQSTEVPVSNVVVKRLVECNIIQESDDTSHLRCAKHGDELYITDSSRNLVIKMDKETVSIKLGQGEWKRVMTETEACEALKNNALGSRYIVTYSGELFDPQDATVAYKTVEGVLRSEERILAETPEDSPFSAFEDEMWSTYWADETGVVQEIDFSRLGVSLVRENNRWLLASDKEWRAAEKQTLNGFILLENSKGELKVLLPVAQNHVVECDLVKDTLIPKNLEARYELARSYLNRGLVDKAEGLLTAALAEKAAAPLSDNERMALERVIKAESTNVRALSVRMRALYLLEKNRAAFPTEDPELNLEPLLKDYLRNLGRVVPLAMQEELFLLQRIQPRLKEMQKVASIRAVELGGDALEITYKDTDKDSVFIDRLAMKVLPFYKAAKVALHKKIHVLKSKDLSEISNLLSQDEVQPLSMKEKMQYRALRMKGQFPFVDEKNPSMEELARYKDLLLNECSKTEWKKGCKNGLVPFLSHTSFFSPHENCKEFAAKLLQLIELNTTPEALKEDIEELQAMKLSKLVRYSKTTPKLPPSHRVLQRGAREMVSIQYMQATRDETPFLHGLREGYLNKEVLVQEASPQPIYTVETADPVLKKENERAQADLEAARSQLSEEVFTYKDGADSAAVREQLLGKRLLEEKKLQELGSLLVGSVTAALSESPFSHNQFAAKKRAYPTIEELCYLAARKDYLEVAKKHYPELNEENLLKIKEAVKEYLLQKLQVQHLERALGQIDDVNQLGKILEQKSAYNFDNPNALTFLILETSLNIILRQDQVDNILDFADKLKNNRSVALQMIMGAGKTSVLQPVLALLLADSDTLSSVMVPEALFEPVREGLVQLLGSSYQQFVVWLPYNRTLAEDISYLKTFHNALVEAQEKGSTVLFTPRQTHSIVTSMYEAYYARKGDKTARERLEYITKIVNLLQLKEVMQMDEADTIMNPKVNFKYPIGERAELNKKRGLVVTDLMMRIAQDKELKSADFVQRFQERLGNKMEKGSPEPFAAVIKPKVVEHAKAVFMEQVKLDDPEDYVGKFLAQSHPDDEAMKEWLREHIPNPDDRNLLGALAHSINNVLCNSLSKQCGMHYGSGNKKGDLLACPYDAADSPKPTMFSDPYEQLIYAVQNILYNGISYDAAKMAIEHMQKAAENEMQATRALLTNTEVFARFKAIMGDDLSNVSLTETPPSERFILAFQMNINKNPQALLEFAQDHLFQQVVVFDANISSTPQTLAGLAKVTGGYTGTLQTGILPKSMEAKAELGTDGKTILSVLNKIEKGTSAIEAISAKNGSLTDQVIARFTQDRDLNVFIDSGGWLKDEKIEQYAEKMLLAMSQERPDIGAVCYIDSKGAKISVERGPDGSLIHVTLMQSQFKTDSGKVISIIPQKYETGTNIPQKATAKAYMSVRKGMTMRDALQSIFRMRKILAKQNIIIGLSDELHGIKTAADLFRYFTANMAEGMKEKNWIAAQHRMRETLEKPLRMLLADEALPNDLRERLFDKMQSLVIQKVQDEPFEAMCRSAKEIDAQEAIDQQVARVLALYDDIAKDKKLQVIVNQKIQELYPAEGSARELLEGELKGCADINDLPQKISTRTADQGQELEAETEQEAEEEEEVQVELKTVSVKGTAKAVPYKPLAETLSQYATRSFSPISRLLPKGVRFDLEYSPNLFINSYKIGTNNHALYRLPEYCLLATGTRVVMVSLEDAARIKEAMREGKLKPPQALALYSQDAERLVSTSETFNPDIARAAVQAKLAAGKIAFSRKEIAMLKAEIDAQAKPKAYAATLRKMLESNIKYLERSREDYPRSLIQQLFASY
ncbi:MAG: DUF3638 domain-containing protein [Verrucomicrobia bacterium]|nr:DUF3638 domain-containing protein [Verrucomicrobiota bacterium]